MQSTPAKAWPMAMALLLFVATFSFAGFVVAPLPAIAAVPNVAQCNGHGPSAMGASTALTCTVRVVNTISNGRTSSTTTLTRDCRLGPCSPGNGTFTSSSTSLVTDIQQCNNSDNDAAHTIRCDVSVTNNISADTPGAQPVSTATVNQCNGSGQGGGGTTQGCNPLPATTTTATITQCNGSGNGGGGTVTCTVQSPSRVSRAIPVRVNQCNGTGNPGGSSVICSTRITTNLTAAASPSSAPASASPAPTGATGGATAGPQANPTIGGTTTGETGTSGAPASTATRGASSLTLSGTTSIQALTQAGQVTRIPVGGVATGGGGATASNGSGLLPLGAGLLMVAAALGGLLWRRSTEVRFTP